MPRWLVSSRTDNGLFRVGLDRKWRPVGEHTATLVSQSRLIYDFATAYALSDNTGYLSAVSDLADALLKHFRTRRKGAWRWAVTGDGRPADDRLSA
jgi:mannose/cellobiose epimerase-like protein (N-acyl-D-glucosamine 2-epimerase family)